MEDQPETIQKPAGCRLPPGQFEREQSPAVLHLPAKEFGLGMRFNAGIMHPRNLWLAAQPLRDGLTVASVVSVGLSNRSCAGATAPAPTGPGTINALVLIDAALTPAALVNAVITTTEAKAMALAAWDVRTRDGLPASGTSTDAVVVAGTGRGEPLHYAGPVTTVGWLIARTVREAIERICHEQVARDGGRRIDW